MTLASTGVFAQKIVRLCVQGLSTFVRYEG